MCGALARVQHGDFRAECVPEKRRSWQTVRLGAIAAQAVAESAQHPPMPTQRRPGSSASRCATSSPDSVAAALPICRKVVACASNDSGQLCMSPSASRRRAQSCVRVRRKRPHSRLQSSVTTLGRHLGHRLKCCCHCHPLIMRSNSVTAQDTADSLVVMLAGRSSNRGVSTNASGRACLDAAWEPQMPQQPVHGARMQRQRR